LQVGEVETPESGPGEVRVRLRASGVNPSDCKGRGGSRPMIAPRVIPHSDGAGVIDRVGPGVPGGRVGERVWIWNGQWERPFGTAAENVVVAAEQAVLLPENTSFEEGACLGLVPHTRMIVLRLVLKSPPGGAPAERLRRTREMDLHDRAGQSKN
jgi:NADPH2:quinone reductase